MADATDTVHAERARLEDRVQKLAADKSNLQLLVRMMNRIGAVAGLDNMVEAMLQAIGDVIGGVGLGVYYRADGVIHYADAFGHRSVVTAVEDELVAQAFATGEVREIEHAFSDTQMQTPEFTKAYTWVVPLKVAAEVIGVVKIESLHVAMRDLAEQLPTFFNYAALTLKNEITGSSRLRKAYAELEQEVAVRKRVEAQLRQANETLEAKVAARTDELQRANQQLSANEVQITRLLEKSEAARLALSRIVEEEKRTQAALHRLNRELRAISNCNEVLMRAVDEPSLLRDVCGVVCGVAGYRMAWVGFAGNDDEPVRAAAWTGITDGEFAGGAWTGNAGDSAPSVLALRNGHSVCLENLAAESHGEAWRAVALARGYRSLIALPLKDEGAATFGVLTVYSAEPQAFTPAEIRLLEELAGDLAFGIVVLRERADRARAEERLRRSEHGLAEAQRIAHLGNWELDLVSNKLSWSDEIFRIFEIDREKFGASYEAFLNAIHPDDREKVNAAYTRSVADKLPYSILHRLKMPDGRVKHVHEQCETHYAEDGRPLRSIGTVHDVTARTQSEQALRESEEKYRTLIQNLQAAVVVHAADTRIVTCNVVAQTLLGLTEDQLLGRVAMDPAWHFFREDGTMLPLEEYPVSRVLATRQPLGATVLGVHRPGSGGDVWVIVNANPVIDEEGVLEAVVVTFIDVTDRQQAQERAALLAAIVESSDDAIIGKALDETIVSWNRGAERIYGYTADEIVGLPISLLVPPGAKEELHAIMEGVRRGEGVEHLETTRVRKDGRMIQVALTISPIRNARGQITGASTIARDVTERKQMEEELRRLNAELEQRVEVRTRELAASEERFRTIYATAPVSIWQEDWAEVLAAIEGLRRDGVTDFAAYFRDHPEFVTRALAAVKILDVNQWTVELFGARDKAEMLASLGTVFATPDTLPGFVGELLALAGGADDYRTEMMLNTVRGDLLHTMLAMSFSPSGRVLVSVVDITERKKAEQQIQRLNDQLATRAHWLEQANKELESFSYSVSHDLRAPLRSIDGFSRIVLEDCAAQLDENGRENLRRVRAASQRMGHLIDDILRLARLARADMHRGPVDLSAIARTLAEELQRMEPARRVEFVIEPNLVAEADANLMGAVMENLLGNAWKFTGRQAEAKIEFGCTRTAGVPTYYVRDNGVGFEMQYAAKLFGAFTRLHTEAEFPGTGIGLASVQRIIHRHGGRVWATGEVGKGATCYFTLTAGNVGAGSDAIARPA